MVNLRGLAISAC